MINNNTLFALPSFNGQIGVARCDITPPIGINSRMWGAAKSDTCIGIHRPLTVTALCLQSSVSEPIFMVVAADLGWWRSTADEWFIRGGIIEAFSLDPSQVLFSLSHTHAGPAINSEDANRAGGHMIPAYLKLVRERTIEACREALATRKKATLTWDQGVSSLAHNRDLSLLGDEHYLCGFNPSGTPDQRLLVGRVTDMENKYIATLVNYACHPTTLAYKNNLISPDYIGSMRETIETSLGGLCLFFQGASGDLAPRDQYTGGPEIADKNGRQLGYDVLAIISGMLPPATSLTYAGAVKSGSDLATWEHQSITPSNFLKAIRIEVEIPLKDLPSLEEIEIDLNSCTDSTLSERLRRKRAVRRMVGSGRTTKMPAWIWQIGDAIVVAHQNEAYSHFQCELRKRFPNHSVIVMNVTNGGDIGYLPPEEFYVRDSYPVWQTPFAAGALERFTAECSETITELISSKPIPN